MDKAKAMIEADPNRSFVVDVFDADSNQKVCMDSDNSESQELPVILCFYI